MREAQFVLPMRSKEGRVMSEVHGPLRRLLCRIFGGYTAFASQGGWLDESTGEIAEEEGITYSVAVADVLGEASLRQVATWAARMACQSALYFRCADGAVELIALNAEPIGRRRLDSEFLRLLTAGLPEIAAASSTKNDETKS